MLLKTSFLIYHLIHQKLPLIIVYMVLKIVKLVHRIIEY